MPIPNVTVRYGCEFVSFAQDAQGVTAEIKNESGSTEHISAQYLAGCDGGASGVRKQLGIALQGEGNILQLRQALYRCDELFDRIPIGKGRHYHVVDTQATQLILQDDTRHFTLHSVVEKDEDMAAMFEKAIAMPLQYEMQWVGEWRQNLLLADRFADGRVFLAGDAVHLMIPTGGLGMNSGVGDAVDLGWKLAATLQGWGGPGLLQSYETERRPVGRNNVAASRFASTGRRKWRSQIKAGIDYNAPANAAERARLVALADVEQRKSNEMIGAELGYFYVSPLIASEPGDPPPYDFIEYKPSTLARRAPAARLARRAATPCRTGSATATRCCGSAAPGMTRLRCKRRLPRSARHSRFWTCRTRRRATSTRAISSCCAPTCTWPGAATQRPRQPERLAAMATGHAT